MEGVKGGETPNANKFEKLRSAAEAELTRRFPQLVARKANITIRQEEPLATGHTAAVSFSTGNPEIKLSTIFASALLAAFEDHTATEVLSPGIEFTMLHELGHDPKGRSPITLRKSPGKLVLQDGGKIYDIVAQQLAVAIEGSELSAQRYAMANLRDPIDAISSHLATWFIFVSPYFPRDLKTTRRQCLTNYQTYLVSHWSGLKGIAIGPSSSSEAKPPKKVEYGRLDGPASGSAEEAGEPITINWLDHSSELFEQVYDESLLGRFRPPLESGAIASVVDGAMEKLGCIGDERTCALLRRSIQIRHELTSD